MTPFTRTGAFTVQLTASSFDWATPVLLLALAAALAAIWRLAAQRIGLARIAHSPIPSTALAEPAPSGSPSSGTGAPTCLRNADSARSVLDALFDRFQWWLPVTQVDGDTWRAFDLLLREILRDTLGAARVRAYRVSRSSERLLALADGESDRPGLFARDGVIGHVVTSGQPYDARACAPDSLLAALAARDEASWSFVWPVRSSRSVIGVIAVGDLRGESEAPPDSLRRLLNLFWLVIERQEAARRAEATDHESGVLNREDILRQGGDLVRSAISDAEPCAVAVLTVEGLRALDETGDWSRRNAALEAVGVALRSRLRTDDRIGRLSDDRFAIVLRRVDSALARLIAGKLQAGVNTALKPPATEHSMSVRIGLAGSGLKATTFDALLLSATKLSSEARRRGLELLLDLDDLEAVV